MRSRTSCFNGTVLIKDLTRFAPLWGGGCVISLLCWLCMKSDLYTTLEISRFMPYFLLVYALLCALCLFGDLYASRQCYGLHALPVNRSAYFLLHCVAGLLFFLIPGSLLFLLLAFSKLWDIAVLLLVPGAAYFLFFFGIALLCVMCTGRRIGAVLVYGIVNFIAPVAQWLLTALYAPLLPGVVINESALSRLSPVLEFEYNVRTMIGVVIYPYDCISSDPAQLPDPSPLSRLSLVDRTYTLICTGVGILAAVLALVLYRRRKLECTGNFAAVKGLGTAFQIAFSLVFAALLWNWLNCEMQHCYVLIPFLALGLFIARVLQARKLNVFHPRGLLILGAMTAVLFGSFGLLYIDAFNIVGYVPDADRVESVVIDTKAADAAPYLSWRSGTVTDPDAIVIAAQAHSELIRTAGSDLGDLQVNLTYNMKDGTRINRSYTCYEDDEVHRQLLASIHTWQTVFGTDDWGSYVDSVYCITLRNGGRLYLDYVFFDPEVGTSPPEAEVTVLSRSMMTDFLNTLRADCENGMMAQTSDFIYWVELYRRGSNNTTVIDTVCITDRHAAAIKYLVECGKLADTCPNKTITLESG